MSGRDGQTLTGTSRLITYVNFVKLPHTVFMLPFAMVGATLGSYVAPVTPAKLGWIVLAFTSARFAAMGFNRIVDREFDGRNPRTARRELPAGALTLVEAKVAVLLASVVFLLAAASLGWICLALSPLALAWILFYSYTKRFTRWSHLVLGVGLAIAPVGGYLAIAGRWSEPKWILVVLALAVAAWSGGFDILYALQDVAFDRAQALHSLPASVGEWNAVRVVRGLHVVTALGLILVGLGTHAGWLYAAGVVIVALLLLYEHSLVHAHDLSRLDAAFFTMNGVISVVFFGFVLAERVVSGLARW
jgi:4-hydroxybenzoate polyprenyltransferase